MGRYNIGTVKPALATTCIERPPVFKDHNFVSLDYGFSLKHVQKEPVHKDSLSIKTTFHVSPERSFINRFHCIMIK